MRVALLSDAHANLPALEAVLIDARQAAVQEVWNLGDFTGYGPFPEEVVRLLSTQAHANIIGNYDQRVLSFKANKRRWRRTKDPEKFLAFQWAYERLSSSSRSYLASLPEQLRREVDGATVLLVHGSPAAVDELLGPDTPADRLADLAAAANADLVACGHTHRPWLGRSGKTRFVNPGSVGRPEGGDPRACYCLLEISAGGFHADLRRVEYDVQKTVRAIRRLSLPEGFAQMLLAGRDLKAVRKAKADAPSGATPLPARGHGRAAANPDTPIADDGEGRGTREGPPPDSPAMRFAERCGFEREHSLQVTRLAMRLFDELVPLHGLGGPERELLRLAGVLHDIGVPAGPKGHHKRAQELILLAGDELPLADRERTLVAVIARYHRKALPSPSHEPFASLPADDRHRVRVLAGLLRVADGLDRGHLSLVRDLSCRVEPKRIVLRLSADGPVGCELQGARNKADLLQTVLGHRLVIQAPSSPDGQADQEPSR